MKRRPWLIAFFLLVAAGVLLLVSRNGGKPVRVRVVHLQTGRVEEIVTGNSVGSVEPVQTAVVASEIVGKVRRIVVRQGPVKAGQSVFELDSRDLEGEREVARREIETSKARIEQAAVRRQKVSEDLERLRKVDVPKSDVDRLVRDLEIARHDEEIARRAIATLEAQMELTELRIRKTRVAAPFDGTVVVLHGEEGESVTPGKALFTLHSAGDPLVRAPVDEADMGRLTLGLPVHVTFDAHRGERFEGVVHEIMPAAVTDKKNNRTVDIQVRLHRVPPAVRAGMSANVEVVLRAVENVPYLPTHLVLEDREGGGRFVHVAENGRAARRAVTVGVWNWETTEISGGLSPRDAVIVPLQFEDEPPVKEGSKVVVLGDGK